MEKRATTTPTYDSTTYETNAYITLPSYLKELIWVRVEDGNIYYPLQRSSPNQIMSMFPDYGLNLRRPTHFAPLYSQSEMIVKPTPDQAYDYDVGYYAYCAELSDDADTNWLTTNFPEVVVFGALIQSAPFLVPDDTRLNIWMTQYQAGMEKLKRAEAAEDFAGSLIYAKIGWPASLGGQEPFDIDIMD